MLSQLFGRLYLLINSKSSITHLGGSFFPQDLTNRSSPSQLKKPHHFTTI